MPLTNQLLALPQIWSDDLARELVPILTSPVGVSSAGWPYLHRPGWERLRDWVPHILIDGMHLWNAIERVEQHAKTVAGSPHERQSFEAACRVVRQVVRTAAITAPADLWLLHQVFSALQAQGIVGRLAQGQVVTADSEPGLLANELVMDLDFLLSRGYLRRAEGGYAANDHQTARDALNGKPHSATPPPPRWLASREQMALGHDLVNAVLTLRVAEAIEPLLQAGAVLPDNVNRALFEAVGTVDDTGSLTDVGRRMLSRGPGPFGIIAAYAPYLAQLPQIWRQGSANLHVQRGANVAASQDANRATFQRANEALDAFCTDTGFEWTVFIEHAIGRGEATRQRFERDGNRRQYFGADLEDPAIDAAMAQQAAGKLPADMVFVRNADIGVASVLIDAIRAAGANPEGAVMLVGNGLHEIRNQSDENMVSVFEEYERAGVLLMFTEENALSTADLLATAWNTYHAGFRYVHVRSGQGLRPATTPAQSSLGPSLATSWTDCAEQAGYVRLEKWCSRRRTIYPYTPIDGHNPAISANHFFAPKRIAQSLGLLKA